MNRVHYSMYYNIFLDTVKFHTLLYWHAKHNISPAQLSSFTVCVISYLVLHVAKVCRSNKIVCVQYAKEHEDYGLTCSTVRSPSVSEIIIYM